MPENEIVLEENETVEVPDVTEDAFLSGLLDDDDYSSTEETAALTNEGDAATAEAADSDGNPADEAAAAANEGEAAEAAAGDTNQPAAEELMELVYNGQTQSLPRSEVIKLAQKGMNYDHVRGQLDDLRGSETHRMLSELAKNAGMPESEFLRKVLENVSTRRADEFASAEGISPELARRLLDAEDEVKRYRAETQQRGERERRNRMYSDFVSAYPDVRPEDIPQAVLDEVRDGADLVSAYRSHENGLLKDDVKRLKETIEQMKQNESNRQKAVGSVRGSKAAVTEDAFLSGLFGE